MIVSAPSDIATQLINLVAMSTAGHRNSAVHTVCNNGDGGNWLTREAFSFAPSATSITRQLLGRRSSLHAD